MTGSENEMEAQRLERIETSVNHVVSRVTSLEEKLTSFEERLESHGRRFDVQMEALREDIKTFAKNLGGRLDAISAQMTDKHKTTDARFSDHEAVRRNHGRRIAALERRARRAT